MTTLLRTAKRGLPPLLASSWVCIAAGCAALQDRAPAASARILLGPQDTVDVAMTGWRLEDYGCSDGLLVCEDRVTKLRCRCSPRVVVQTLNAVR